MQSRPKKSKQVFNQQRWPWGWSRTRTGKDGFLPQLSPCSAEWSWQLQFSHLQNDMVTLVIFASYTSKTLCKGWAAAIFIYLGIEEKEAVKTNAFACSAGKKSEELLSKMKLSISTWQAAWIIKLQASAMGKTRSTQLGIHCIVSCVAQKNVGPVINPCLWWSQQIYV